MFDSKLQFISPFQTLSGAPPFPRFLREGGGFDFPPVMENQNPRPVSQNPRDKDGAPSTLHVLFWPVPANQLEKFQPDPDRP